MESCFRHPLFDLRGTRKVEIRHIFNFSSKKVTSKTESFDPTIVKKTSNFSTSRLLGEFKLPYRELQYDHLLIKRLYFRLLQIESFRRRQIACSPNDNSVFTKVENIVGKKEKMLVYQHFLLFPTMFSKTSFVKVV